MNRSSYGGFCCLPPRPNCNSWSNAGTIRGRWLGCWPLKTGSRRTAKEAPPALLSEAASGGAQARMGRMVGTVGKVGGAARMLRADLTGRLHAQARRPVRATRSRWAIRRARRTRGTRRTQSTRRPRRLLVLSRRCPRWVCRRQAPWRPRAAPRPVPRPAPRSVHRPAPHARPPLAPPPQALQQQPRQRFPGPLRRHRRCPGQGRRCWDLHRHSSPWRPRPAVPSFRPDGQDLRRRC